MIYYRLNTINCQNILFFIKLNLFIKITENFKKIRFTGDLQTFLSAMSSSKEPHCEGGGGNRNELVFSSGGKCGYK
jgi:hypothetical protein